jgi:hypothetical protein
MGKVNSVSSGENVSQVLVVEGPIYWLEDGTNTYHKLQFKDDGTGTSTYVLQDVGQSDKIPF